MSAGTCISGQVDCDYGPEDVFTCSRCSEETCFCEAGDGDDLCATCWCEEHAYEVAEMHGQERFDFGGAP